MEQIKEKQGILSGILIGAFSVLAVQMMGKKEKKVENMKRSVRVMSIEMGGTSCRVSIGVKSYNRGGEYTGIEIEKYKQVATKGPKETMDSIFELAEGEKVEEVGIGSFGPLCLSGENLGTITSTPKKEWIDFPLLKEVKRRSSMEVVRFGIDTDVNCGAMGEHRLGGYSSEESLAYITVGTGVGVGLVVKGQTVHGLLHPEGGHVLASRKEGDSFEGVCNFHGSSCIEGLVTNVAIAKRKGITIEEVPLLEENDEVWEIVGYYLAQLCLSVLMIASPHVILLGGGVMNRKALLPIVHKYFSQMNNNYLQHTSVNNPQLYIKSPSLRDSAMFGAYLLQDTHFTLSPLASLPSQSINQ